MSELSKMERYRSVRKSIVFLCTISEQLEFEIYKITKNKIFR